MNTEIRDRFNPHLEEGEAIVWCGRPDRNIKARPEELGEYIKIFTPLLFLPVVLGIGATYQFGWIPAVMFGGGIAFFGLVMWSYVLETEGKLRDGICYAITNRRILELWTVSLPPGQTLDGPVAVPQRRPADWRDPVNVMHTKLISLNLSQICWTQVGGYADGSGTLQFSTHDTTCPKPTSPWIIMHAANPARRLYPIFILLPEIDGVSETLNAARLRQEQLNTKTQLPA